MDENGMAYYLEDLNRLHDLSMEKLGEWKENYPYCQTVHFLMAKKHQLEGFIDDMQVFHMASFYSVDRAYLQERMTASEREHATEHEAPMQVESYTVQTDEDQKETSKEVIEKSIPAQELEEVAPLEVKEVEVAVESKVKQKPAFDVDEDLSPFAKWINGFANVGIDKGKKKKKKKQRKSKLEKQIEKSVIKEEDIVSEPLAQILAAQGHVEKATEMYEKLSLIFPEKSSFFALQIEKLNNSK